MNIIYRAAVAASVATVLTACGGGGGGGFGGSVSDGIGDSLGDNPIGITADNAIEVTAGVVQSIEDSAAGASTDIPGFPLGIEVSGVSLEESTSIAGEAVKRVTGIAKLASMPAGVTFTEPCDAGSITIDTNATSENLTGTRSTITYNGCVLTLGDETITSNGQLVIEFLEDSGDILISVYTIDTITTFNNFRVRSSVGGQPDDVASFDGSARVFLSADGAFETTRITYDTVSLTLNGVTSNFSDFSTEIVCTLDLSICEFSSAGIADIPALSGTVRFEYEDFVAPREPGVVDIFGDGGSYLECVSDGPINVTLNLDSDGDGEIDDVIATTWDELLGI